MQKRDRRAVGGCRGFFEGLRCAERTCSARTRAWAVGLLKAVAAAWRKPAAVAPLLGALTMRGPYQNRQQLLLFPYRADSPFGCCRRLQALPRRGPRAQIPVAADRQPLLRAYYARTRRAEPFIGWLHERLRGAG